MKVKHILIVTSFALATAAQAQVKIGSNPTNISPNAVLDVEGTSSSHTVVLQNGNTGVGTVTPGNKLEINQGTAGNSGLRFTQMNNASAPATTRVAPLGIDSNGDVVIADGAASKQYLSVARHSTPINVYEGQDILFNGIPASNNTIAYDQTTGVATLTVGKTYIITASMHVTRDVTPGALGFGYIQFALVNHANNSPLTQSSRAEIIANNYSTWTASSGTISVIYKAVTGANTVKMRSMQIRGFDGTSAGQCVVRADLFTGFTIVEL